MLGFIAEYSTCCCVWWRDRHSVWGYTGPVLGFIAEDSTCCVWWRDSVWGYTGPACVDHAAVDKRFVCTAEWVSWDQPTVIKPG